MNFGAIEILKADWKWFEPWTYLNINQNLLFAVQAFLMAHYFQGGYQSKAQRIEDSNDSTLPRQRTGMRLRTGLILMSYSKERMIRVAQHIAPLVCENSWCEAIFNKEPKKMIQSDFLKWILGGY